MKYKSFFSAPAKTPPEDGHARSGLGRALAIGGAVGVVLAILGAYLIKPDTPPPIAPVIGKPSFVPSPMAAGNAVEPNAKASEPAPKTASKPVAPGLYPREAEFARLTAKDATPAMLSQAWDDVRRCKYADDAMKAGVQSIDGCELAPGTWQDAQTVRRILEARVARTDYGVGMDVFMERSGAFTGYPEEWRRLFAEAQRTSLEKAEPIALAGESDLLLREAKDLREQGREAEAKEAYRDAAVHAVASAIGSVWEINRARGRTSTTVSLDDMPAVAKVKPYIAKDEWSDIVKAGNTLAQKWKQAS